MNKRLLMVPIIAILVLVMLSPAVAVAETDDGDISVRPIDDIRITAGQSQDFTFTMFNRSSDDYLFQLKDYDSDGISITYAYTDPPVIEGVGGENTKTVAVTVSVDKFTQKGDYDCSIPISLIDMRTQEESSLTLSVKVSVVALYSEDAYNKVLGLFTVPGIDSPAVNGAITLIIWFVITLGVIIVYNLIVRLVFKDEEDRKIAKNKISWIWFFIIMIYGVYNTMLVLGTDKRFVDMYWTVMELVYILFFALVVWNIYKALVHRFFTKMEKKDDLGGLDTSLIPLFNMIGKILISCVSVGVFLYSIGVNIAGILTGAGIIGLAISLGAQNILTELFGGISIILTRPFIKDDMVRIGDSDEVYEVVDIGLLNTEFKEWSNTTHIIIPNSIVSKSKITNCTMIHDAYRVFMYIDVGYSSDVDLVKKILIEVANEHPHTVRSEEYPKPEARLESFGASAITFRLAVYVDNFDDSTIYLGEMREAAIKKMNAAGVDIPFTRYEVYKME